MTAIFDALAFVGYSLLTPTNPASGYTPTTDAVSIILSDGTTQTVFSSLGVARRCQTYMNSKNQYYLQASDDIVIINCETKLLICEMTFLVQKLLNSYTLLYHGGAVKAVHRNLSSMVSLQDALISVGLRNLGNDFQGNYDLETNLADQWRPRIKVVDYYFVATVTSSTQGSQLSDSTPIQIDLTP